MHPFRLVPENSKFSVVEGQCSGTNLSYELNGNKLAQQINDKFIATVDLSSSIVNKIKPLKGTPTEIDIESLWKSIEPSNEIDIDPKPPSIDQSYHDMLFKQTPLFFFVKQVLNKARACMPLEEYLNEIDALSIDPIKLDLRYDPQNGEPQFLEYAERKVADESINFSTAIDNLRARDTQLQTMFAMELHCGGREDVDSKLQLYFDRLCIWQAVGTHPQIATNFCTSVLVPFYKVRAPQKTRELVRVSKGTVRTGQIKPNKPRPEVKVRTPGLIKVLQRSASTVNNEPVAEQQPAAKRLMASRSVSHPVYRQPSTSVVEVRFRTKKKPQPQQPPPPPKPKEPESPPRRTPLAPNAVQATPEKVRKQVLEMVEDDEEIGSTDSDS